MLCWKCMREYTGSVCGWCGFTPQDYRPFPDALRPGTLLRSRYLLGITLGKGGFGTTYVGLDQASRRKVAIKEYFPAAIAARAAAPSEEVAVHTSRDLYAAGVQKFYNEAAALARLGHIPSIVKVFDFFYANGTAYIVMEHIEGMPIDQMAKRQGPLDLGLTLTIYYPVMDALAAVHREGLLHRDIAPNNIILDAQYRARLIDFGASRAFSQEISTDMSVILKNGFAPVEQYTRRGRHGPWEDIYALCASIYYTMTGKIPPASTERLVFDTLKPLSAYGQDVPPLFERVIARGMAVRAEERYQSMEELMADVEQLVGPAPAGERTSVPLPEPRPPKAAANWLPAAAAVLGGAALAGIVWLLLF